MTLTISTCTGTINNMGRVEGEGTKTKGVEMGGGARVAGGGGQGDLCEVMIVHLQTRLTIAEDQIRALEAELDDRDVEIVARDVQFICSRSQVDYSFEREG